MKWEDDEKRRTKWPVRLFFTAVTLFIAAGVVYFVHGAKDPRYTTRRPPAAGPADYTNAAVGDRLLLELNRDCRVSDLRLVYRGAEDGRLVFEATLLMLDPDYAYVHRIDPKPARQAFPMGGHTFRLLSWDRSRVRLELLR